MPRSADARQFAFLIDDDLRRRLHIEAGHQQVSVSQVVRRLLRHALDQAEAERTQS